MEIVLDLVDTFPTAAYANLEFNIAQEQLPSAILTLRNTGKQVVGVFELIRHTSAREAAGSTRFSFETDIEDAVIQGARFLRIEVFARDSGSLVYVVSSDRKKQQIEPFSEQQWKACYSNADANKKIALELSPVGWKAPTAAAIGVGGAVVLLLIFLYLRKS
jgi:hypothetical protein